MSASNVATGTFKVTVFAQGKGKQRLMYPVQSYVVIGSKVYAVDRAMRDYREEYKKVVAPQIALTVNVEQEHVVVGTTLPPMPKVKKRRGRGRRGPVRRHR